MLETHYSETSDAARTGCPMNVTTSPGRRILSLRAGSLIPLSLAKRVSCADNARACLLVALDVTMSSA